MDAPVEPIAANRDYAAADGEGPGPVQARSAAARGWDESPAARGSANDSMVGWRRRTLFAIGSSIAIAGVVALLWFARSVVLLMFGGLLLAVFLETCTGWVRARSRLPWAWSLATVLAFGTAAIGGTLWLKGPDIATQAEQLRERLPQAFGQLASALTRTQWAAKAAAQLADLGQWIDAGLIARLTGALSSAAALLGGAFIILFVGCYVSAEPRLYAAGVIRLTPLAYRGRAWVILHDVVHTLRWWLVAKVISMTVVGALVTTGLLLIGIPLAWTLGALAAALTFIPNVGPMLSVGPPLLLALTMSSEQALAVILLFWGVHTIEGFFVTPIAERRALKLPPALTIAGQVLLGVAGGVLGVALAAPLVATGLVLVRSVYIEDVLGDRGHATSA